MSTVGRVRAQAKTVREIGIVIASMSLVFAAELAARSVTGFSLPSEARTLPALLSGAICAVVLAWRRGDAVTALGLSRPKSILRSLAWAISIVVAFILLQNLSIPLAAYFDVPPPDYSRYDYLKGDTLAAVLTWILLIFSAAIPEELLFRGFLQGRLAEWIGGPYALWLAAVGQAVIFGLSHFQWGFGGIVSTTLMGLVWGTAYVLCGRNLYALITAHSLAHLLLVAQLSQS